MNIPALFNVSEIARELYPGKKDTHNRLHKKINEQHGRRLTEKERVVIAKFIQTETDKFISELFSQNT